MKTSHLKPLRNPLKPLRISDINLLKKNRRNSLNIKLSMDNVEDLTRNKGWENFDQWIFESSLHCTVLFEYCSKL